MGLWDFLGSELNFGQKGFICIFERCWYYFGLQNKTQGFFGVLCFSSAQIDSNISAINLLLVLVIFWGMLKT